MMPSCDQTGVPIHFHSSTTSGSASLMSLRILLRVSPRQSPSSAILFEMSSGADWPWLVPDFFMFSSYIKLLAGGAPRSMKIGCGQSAAVSACHTPASKSLGCCPSSPRSIFRKSGLLACRHLAAQECAEVDELPEEVARRPVWNRYLCRGLGT